MINQLLGTLYHSSLADKELAKAKSLYRDAVWRLRETLKDYGIDIIDFARGVLKLKTLDFECDYYKFLEGDKKVYLTTTPSPIDTSIAPSDWIDYTP